MLRVDPQMPFLDMVRSRPMMKEFCRREVLPALWPGAKIAEVAIDSMTYTPGRKCVILYSLASHEGSGLRWAVATFAKDDRLQGVYAEHYAAGANGTRGSGARSAKFLPAYRCLVELFPMDWHLSALGQATNPHEVAPLLARALPDAGSAPDWQPQVEVIRYRPHESCVLRYRLNGGSTEVIGKLYRDQPKAERAWRALNDLHPQAAPAGVIVPQPLANEHGWNLILMERAPGVSMKRLVKEASVPAEAKGAARLAAAALAAYHGLRFESDDVRSIQSELQKLRQRAARLHLVAPALAGGVDALLDRAELLADKLAPAKPSLIHGDCKPSQLLIDGGRVAVVDFDRAGLGDPAIDVGNFMAQFHKEALATGEEHLRQLSEYFLAEYQSQAPRDGLAARARIFQVVSLLRMTVRKFQGSPHSYARKGPASPQVLLLEEAASCLARL